MVFVASKHIYADVGRYAPTSTYAHAGVRVVCGGVVWPVYAGVCRRSIIVLDLIFANLANLGLSRIISPGNRGLG